MASWHEMAEMTSPEFGEAKPEIRIALIPVGATEQHGPNLALSTDYVVAHRLCRTHRFLQIALFQRSEAILGMARPDTGIAIGLKFGQDGYLVGVAFADLTAQDLLTRLNATPVVRCDEVAWRFLGLSMAAWNAVFSAGLAVVWGMAARRA